MDCVSHTQNVPRDACRTTFSALPCRSYDEPVWMCACSHELLGLNKCEQDAGMVIACACGTARVPMGLPM